MIFIPKKLRILPLSVAMITALSFSSSVFAAATLQPPTTTYNAGTQTVTVSSTVNNVANNEEVTYLVKQTLAPSNIIFIDQKNSLNSTSVTFSFTTAYINLAYAATIKFGAATTAVTQPDDPALFLTRSIVGSSTTLGSRVLNNATNNLISFGALTNSTTGLNKVEADNDIEEYGILFTNDNALNSIDYENVLAYQSTDTTVNGTIAGLSPTSEGVKKFPAWGKNDSGQFAINLVNGQSGLLEAGTTCHTRTYVKYKKEGTTTYIVAFGPVRPVDL